MEIDAIRMAAAPAPKEIVPSIVAPDEIAAFSQALFGQSEKKPEISAITRLQDKSQAIQSAITTAQGSVLDSPLKMLSAQSNMLHAIVEVDLIAKTAGALGQGVNKLVSMQ